jgi:hypothetical protein
MLIKIVIMLFMLVILVSLGSALFYLLREQDSKKMAKALTLRIGLSLGLFILLLVAFAFGWITPHAITP